MDAPQQNPEQFSSIPPVNIPTFESPIPPYLLNGADAEMQYVLNSLSRHTQIMDWLCRVGTEQNSQIRRLEGQAVIAQDGISKDLKKLDERLYLLEIWKIKITGIWPVIVAVFCVLSAVADWAFRIFSAFIQH